VSKEFNFRRAHREWARPQYENLHQDFKDLYSNVTDNQDKLNQDKQLQVQFPKDVPSLFDQCNLLLHKHGAEAMAISAVVIYYWGHWAHTYAVTVHYPGLQPKRFVSGDWDPFQPRRDARA